MIGRVRKELIAAEKIRIQAFLAGLFAGILFFCIAVSSIDFGEITMANKARLFLAFIFIIYSSIFYLATRKKQVVSEVFVGLSSFLFLATVPVFALIFLLAEDSLAERVSVSMVLGLFLHYAVLRLSSRLGLLIGLVVSVFSLAVIQVSGSDGAVRAAIYLIATNMAGVFVSNGILRKDFLEDLAKSQIKREWSRQRAARNEFDKVISEHKVWVATISHEINQPLAVAFSKLDFIEKEIKVREIANFGILSAAASVKDNLVEVSEVLNAIIKKASDSSGAIETKLTWTKLYDVLAGVMEHIGLSSSDLDSMLKIDSSMLADLYVYTDQYLLKRVIRNLIENSIKYSPSGVAGIAVSFKLKEKGLSLIITNKISQSDLPCTRSEVSQRENGLRLGLGLGIGSGFARTMNGTLPGQKVGLRFFRKTLAVARVSFKDSFYSLGPPFEVGLRYDDRISVFADSVGLVNLIAAVTAGRGLRLDVYTLSELSRRIGFESSAATQLRVSIFVVEVCQNLLSARDFFGDELYDVVCDFGRFIFVSETALDVSFNDLGLVVESFDDIPLFFNELVIN